MSTLREESNEGDNTTKLITVVNSLCHVLTDHRDKIKIVEEHLKFIIEELESYKN
jgi:hypothetical protein